MFIFTLRRVLAAGHPTLPLSLSLSQTRIEEKKPPSPSANVGNESRTKANRGHLLRRKKISSEDDALLIQVCLCIYWLIFWASSPPPLWTTVADRLVRKNKKSLPIYGFLYVVHLRWALEEGKMPSNYAGEAVFIIHLKNLQISTRYFLGIHRYMRFYTFRYNFWTMFPAISNLVKQGVRTWFSTSDFFSFPRRRKKSRRRRAGAISFPPSPPSLSPIPSWGGRKEDEEEEEEEEEGGFRMLLRCLGEMLLPRETFKTAAAAASFP